MMDAKLKNALCSIRLCQYLNTQELDTLIDHNKIISFAPGEVILQQGKKSDGIYVIIEGSAIVTAKVLGAGHIKLITLNHGNCIGTVSFIEKGPRTTTVTAKTPVECLFINNAYFSLLTHFEPKTKHKIIRAITEDICDRLKISYQKITHIMKHTDMETRSLLGEVIKSFTKPTLTNLQEMNILMELIKKSIPFNLFTEEEFNELLSLSTLIQATKQCPILQETDTDLFCFIVIYGAIQTSIIHDNKIAKLAILGPGSFFGNMSIVEAQSAALINYTTCENAIILKIPCPSLEELQKKQSTLWYKISELLCESFVILERAAEKLNIRLQSEFYNEKEQ